MCECVCMLCMLRIYQYIMYVCGMYMLCVLCVLLVEASQTRTLVDMAVCVCVYVSVS